MGRATIDDEPPGSASGRRWRVELRLEVWAAEDGWHALLFGPGTRRREFASPFELARCLASPPTEASTLAAPPEGGRGLR